MDDKQIAELLADGVMDGGKIDHDRDVPSVQIDDKSGNLNALALQLWLYDGGRDMKIVQELLHDRTGILVSMQQLRGWAREGRWSDFARPVHQALATRGTDDARAHLQVAVSRATAYFLRVLGGSEKADNAKTRVAMTVLDRAGFPILLRGEMFGNASIGKEVGEYAEWSDSELEAEYRSYSADDDGVVSPDPRPTDSIFHDINDAAFTQHQSRQTGRIAH